MTAILGVEHPTTGALYLATDRRCVNNSAIVSDAQEKTVDLGPAIVAICGDLRAVTVVEREASRGTLPHFPDPWSVIDWLTQLFKADGWEPRDEVKGQAPGMANGGILLWRAPPHRGIYDYCGTMALTRLEPGRPAGRGSGGQEAIGAFLGLTDGGSWNGQGVVRAIEIAALVDSGVGGGVSLFSSPGGAVPPASRNHPEP